MVVWKDVGVLDGDGDILDGLWVNGMGILEMGLLRCCEKSKSLRDMGNGKNGCPALIYMRDHITANFHGCRAGEDLDGNSPNSLTHLRVPPARPVPASSKLASHLTSPGRFLRAIHPILPLVVAGASDIIDVWT